MKKILFGLALLIILSTACLASNATEVPQKVATQPARNPADQPLPTLPPALAQVEFPAGARPYPAGWPAELQFPGAFQAVDFNQGAALPGGSKVGYSLKLLYAGALQNALTSLRSALADKKWTVADESDLDSGGKVWIVSRQPGGSGLLVIEPQEAGKIGILATFYP